MWKSLLDSVVEAFAMCDPVAHMHYIEWKRETALQAAVTPQGERASACVDEWVAFGERMGISQDNEDAGARRPGDQPFVRFRATLPAPG